MDGGRFIYVGEVPASGKTTVSSLTAEKTGSIYVSSGGIKRPEARKRFGKNLSSLGQRESFEINGWFFQGLSSKNSGGLYLVDTHYTYPVGESFVKLMPEECVPRIELFVLFEADAETVVDRRIARGRDRDSVDKDFIQVEIEEEREEAMRLSEKFSVPLGVIENVGTIENGVKCLEGFLKD